MAHRHTTVIFILAAKTILLVSAQLRPEDYRLPELYTPSSYEIALDLAAEAFTASSNEFSGTVTIRFSFINITDYIALHSQHNFITISKITFNSTEVLSGNYSINNVTDILTINVGHAITTGITYDLVIEYTGVLSTGDMYGLYKSSYVDSNGLTKYLVTTQFAATFARRAFPCFDEPALKTTFDFSVTFPTGLNVLFNTQQYSSVSNATTGESALLWDQNESSNRYQQRVVTVVAHELAHQWFGNLITFKWWSEIFLNEGFATYFEFHITHEVLPAWELDKQFVIEEVHQALLGDALENAHALQSPTTTPAEISSKFSIISYSKGGSVLRMVEHFMRLDNFRAGLQRYLNQL
ncbi:hypothetical protein NQ314_008320 [Rhamnusium bicolor]|uniref:Peptidase M1 membrane alanine aminopeptidase domain-containing protein n=1 Tax=Rhamnusium bicolor TaxID=1586634 RepID=A0AAV8YDA3_9CUCU|nr:hypothetical protein NQ314_008320 [Rhamnusium bicolor]